MPFSHLAGVIDVMFADSNLIADAALVAVVALAEQIGMCLAGVWHSSGAQILNPEHR